MLTLILAGIAAVFTLLYGLFVPNMDIITKLSNSFFLIGFVLLAIGLIAFIRNLGVFKTLGYMKYVNYKIRMNKKKANGEIPAHTYVQDFTEYNMEKLEKQWNAKPFLWIGAPLFILSIVLGLFRL